MSMSDKEAINYFFDVLILIILEVLYESKWKNKRTFKNCLNPYYTGSTLWAWGYCENGKKECVLILIILEVLYERTKLYGAQVVYIVLILIILEVLYESIASENTKDTKKEGLNPYYTGSTLWVFVLQNKDTCVTGLNPYYTGSTLWEA